jgi:hypothetical protein
MRNTQLSITTALLLLIGAINANGQSMQGPPVAPRIPQAYGVVVNINGEDGFYLRKDLHLSDASTIINGQRVLGTPFLYYEWLNGFISTPDGRVYNYPLRYDVSNQNVYFTLNSDSMQVNEEIKEFILEVVTGDSLVRSRFVNANQYKKESRTFYYEVLLESDKGQLLKLNNKVVATLNDELLASNAKKYFKLEASYFYYDKITKKIARIKPGGSNIPALLNLNQEQASSIQIVNNDLSNEAELIKIFSTYLKPTPKEAPKAF